jgi:hypothetical protein
VSSTSAVAVRAVSGDAVITAGRVHSDGSFTLSLPAGKAYRLEVLTASGVLPIVASSTSDLAFRVCQPTDPWDMGGISASGGGMGGGNGGPGGMGSGGGGPDCNGDPDCGQPPSCDPMTDPNCMQPPPPCDPATDPNCMQPPPPQCDPMTDPNCWQPPPPCDPATDPNCMQPPPPPCDPATDPNCMQPPPPQCDPMTDPTCQPPPCADPNDPNSCQDPCMTDPLQCGCMDSTNGSAVPVGTGPNAGGCWPDPLPPCSGANCAPGGMAPANPPGNFGCGGSTGS